MGSLVGRLRRPCALVLTKRSYTNIIRWFCSWFSLKWFSIWSYTNIIRFIHGWYSLKGIVFGHIENIFYLLIPGLREHWGENASEMGFFTTFLNGGWIGRRRRPCAQVLIKRSYTNIIRFIHGWFSMKGFSIWPYTDIFYLSTYNDTI